MNLFKLIVELLAFLLHLAVALVECLFWLLYLLRELRNHGADALRVWRRSRGGGYLCDCGAEVPTEGIFECGGCGFVYEGSVWQCENPECLATTVHAPCSCGLSVRSPYRWGRP